MDSIKKNFFIFFIFLFSFFLFLSKHTCLFKYPFFQYGPRYAQATGETLLDGYYKLGKGYLLAYFFVNLGTMFTIQSAVTVVTAGLASKLFGITNDIVTWSIIITLFCSFIQWSTFISLLRLPSVIL